VTGRAALATFAQGWGCDDARAAITAACRTLLASSGQLSPPYELRSIWKGLGARVAYDLDVGDGALDSDGERWLVRVRRHARRLAGGGAEPHLPRSWRRSRFTVAHELGHLILLQGTDPRLRAALADPDIHDEVEMLCNKAAAELLMPARRFSADARTVGFSPEGLRWMYDSYLVSWPALLKRYTEVFNANASVWEPAVRAGDGELMRIAATYGSPDGSLWLPREVSERMLTQPIVRLALRDDVAGCRRLSAPARHGDRVALGVASVLPYAPPSRRAFPVWRGNAVLDDPMGRAAVALLTLPPSALRAWAALLTCRPLDWRTRAVAPAALAMRLAA
jgi:hypothetical protein